MASQCDRSSKFLPGFDDLLGVYQLCLNCYDLLNHKTIGLTPEQLPAKLNLEMKFNMKPGQSMTCLSLLLLAISFTGTPAQENKPKDPPPPSADNSWKPLGKDLWFDAARRELVILTQVVLREGPLEHLLCLKGTKEHESILATSAEARAIHAGLLLTNAVPDHPVRFQPKFEPPAGSKIRIQLKWTDDKNQQRSAEARNWVRNFKTNKPIEIDWVFGGSLIVEDPRTKKPFYAATEGDYFTVANFASAILDLPVPSSASDAERQFEAYTPNVPPLGTWVWMHLSPLPKTNPEKP